MPAPAHPGDSSLGLLTRIKLSLVFLVGFFVATLAYALLLGALPESTIGIDTAGKGSNTIIWFLGYMVVAYLGGMGALWLSS